MNEKKDKSIEEIRRSLEGYYGDEFLPEHLREKYRTINVGIIGCGDAGRAHIIISNQIRDRERVVALYDIHEFQVKDTLSVCPEPKEVKVCKNIEEMLNDPDIEAVYVTTPNNHHKEYVLAALRAGKHVFCEKPLAHTLEDAYEIVKAWQDSGLIVQVGLTYRYAKIFRRVKEILDSGYIGYPVMIWCKEPRPPFPRSRGRDWRYSQEATGGVLNEKDCHHFDLFNWFSGSKPKKVSAFGGANVIKYDTEILDSVFVNLEYENNVIANLSLCTFSESNYKLIEDFMEVGINGSEGRLVSWVNRDLIKVFHNATQERQEIIIQPNPREGEELFHKGFLHEHLDFLRCINKGEQAFANPTIGIWSMYPAFAGEMSIKEDRTVYIKELIKE